MEMDRAEQMRRVIEQYQQDEETMVRLFVKWCFANEADPVALYTKAYPGQPKNEALAFAIAEDDGEPLEISDSTMLELLQLFGNDDLAFVLAEESDKKSR